MTQLLGYLNAAFVEPISRGATQWAPAFANVPVSVPNGFYIPRYPQTAPALGLTIFSLTTQGYSAGYGYQAPVAGQPLGYNPYDDDIGF